NLVGWKAVAISSMGLLVAASRDSMEEKYRLAVSFGWLAPLLVSLFQYRCTALGVPFFLACLHAICAREEGTYEAVRTRFVNFLNLVDSFRSVDGLVRITIGATLNTMMTGLVHWHVASEAGFHALEPVANRNTQGRIVLLVHFTAKLCVFTLAYDKENLHFLVPVSCVWFYVLL
ncbi:unnamed protein product, partial [Symbiodinium pilosum]